jgi:hypothetical protein
VNAQGGGFDEPRKPISWASFPCGTARGERAQRSILQERKTPDSIS